MLILQLPLIALERSLILEITLICMPETAYCLDGAAFLFLRVILAQLMDIFEKTPACNCEAFCGCY